MFTVASTDLYNMGITVVSYTLKDIRDDEVSIHEYFGPVHAVPSVVCKCTQKLFVRCAIYLFQVFISTLQVIHLFIIIEKK